MNVPDEIDELVRAAGLYRLDPDAPIRHETRELDRRRLTTLAAPSDVEAELTAGGLLAHFVRAVERGAVPERVVLERVAAAFSSVLDACTEDGVEIVTRDRETGTELVAALRLHRPAGGQEKTEAARHADALLGDLADVLAVDPELSRRAAVRAVLERRRLDRVRTAAAVKLPELLAPLVAEHNARLEAADELNATDEAEANRRWLAAHDWWEAVQVGTEAVALHQADRLTEDVAGEVVEIEAQAVTNRLRSEEGRRRFEAASTWAAAGLVARGPRASRRATP